MVTFVRYVATKKTFLDQLQVITSQDDLYKFLELHKFPQKLRDRLKIKNRELRIEQKKIQRHICLDEIETKKTLMGFKKKFKNFNQYSLPTKKQFEAKLNEETGEQITSAMDKIAEDSLNLGDDNFVWDSVLVEGLVTSMSQLKDKLGTVEESTRTIIKRQEAL